MPMAQLSSGPWPRPSSCSPSEDRDMSIDIADLLASAQALAPEFEAWRRDIHQHPELGFE